MFYKFLFLAGLLFSPYSFSQLYNSDLSLLQDLKVLSSSKMQGRKTASPGAKLAAN